MVDGVLRVLKFNFGQAIMQILKNNSAESQAETDSILPGFRALAKSQLCLTLLL
jgi:hypothetical protein